MADELDLFGGDANQPPVDPVAIQSRAAKYDFAMADKSPGIDYLNSMLLQQQDGMLRDNFAHQQETDLNQTRLDIYKQYISSNGGKPVGPEETNFLLGLS